MHSIREIVADIFAGRPQRDDDLRKVHDDSLSEIDRLNARIEEENRPSWEKIIDSWAIPQNLRDSWEINRRKILEYAKAKHPNAPSAELLHHLVFTDPNLRLIWTQPAKPKQPKPAQPVVDISKVTVPEIAQRQKQLEHQDAVDRLRQANANRINHARKQDSKPTAEDEAARKAAYEAMREKQRRLNVGRNY